MLNSRLRAYVRAERAASGSLGAALLWGGAGGRVFVDSADAEPAERLCAMRLKEACRAVERMLGVKPATLDGILGVLAGESTRAPEVTGDTVATIDGGICEVIPVAREGVVVAILLFAYPASHPPTGEARHRNKMIAELLGRCEEDVQDAWAATSRMFHDISSPVRAARQILAEWQAGHLPVAAREEYISLASDLLDSVCFSVERHADAVRESRGVVLPLRATHFDIVAELRKQVRATRAQARSARQCVNVIAVSEEVPVVLDRSLVARSLHGLLENCLRCSPSGGDVTIEIRRRKSAVQIVVRDQGSGLPPEVREQLVDESSRDGHEPNGWPLAGGLLAVRRDVRRMGGRLTVQLMDHGTCVVVMLPLASPA